MTSDPLAKYYPPRTVDDMNVIGDLFGLRFADENMVELYIEDDGWFHFKLSFHRTWLKDLREVTHEALCRSIP
jgi:hypothetical protein